ncbi:K02A2.6-like, partial [Cordylochernes scorpioides]
MEGIKPPAEFVPYSNEKKWETWRESFEIFAIAVNLESMPLVRQRAILKHIAGEKTVMIYKTFHISENDTYPNVKEMLDMLTNHFRPFKNTIQRRNAFFTCVQKERQGIMEFVTELKHLAQECEFENLTESLIRDRLIIGILDREVKRKLLEDPQLTLPRAISIAMISESTCSQVASLNEQKMIEKIEKRNWVKDRIRMENAEAGPSGINPRRERIIEPCKWCGQRHKYGKCPAYGKKCNACGKTNHFAVVCQTKRIRNLLAESEAEESCDEINLNEVAVRTVGSDKWSAVIIINGKKTTVHLDTGAQINVLPHKVINQWPSRPEIRPTSLKAFAYGNTELPIIGKCNVLCQYGEKKGMFEFIVADVEAQTLITGDTCEKLEILRRINHINTDEMKLCSETQKILEQYHEVFQGVGLINSECKIYTKPEYSPVQVPPRRIPTSLGAEVQSELEKMVKQGIVTKIYHETEWSHPMVVVKKKSGQIRICLDPRKLNEALVGRHFQTPAPAELLHEIPKAKYYTVLDVKSAYWHIPVAKECRDLLVMTTPFGKFRYNRLPFGLKISAQIFVEKMTNIFRDSFQNITYVDDLLIYADTIQEHNKKLKGILEKAKEKNIKFDLTKAQICLTKVRFLGHLISQNGIDPEPNKIDKLITFKRPEDKKSLQRIMGLYNYLGKFIPNLAASTSNIRGILRKNVVWHWGPKQDGEFDHIKECVRNAPSLAHFDKSKMLILQCGASKDAMGAALLQEDRPLAFASASFSDSQKQYSQIEKELLSVYYGCKKFEYLLSGLTFVVQTDHQPLLPLVKKTLSDISPRLQRLVMKLIAFDFKLQYKPGKYLIVADTLSRDTHPMDKLPTPFLEDKRMVKMVRVNISDEKLVAMQKDTREDPALVKVIDYVVEGWPICKKDVDEDAKVFFDFRHRLYLWNDLLCIGSAIVIPKTQRNNMLNLLHQSHQGISAIQGLARESLFWPRMSIDIAEKVKNCEICQKYQKSKIQQPLKPFPVPDYPWQTVSLDIFYIQKKPHLLVVDRYSGYPEVFALDPPMAINVKNKLRETFARFGIPETMMSDNQLFGKRTALPKGHFDAVTGCCPLQRGGSTVATLCGKMSRQATNLVWAESPSKAEEKPARPGSLAQPCAELSANQDLQNEIPIVLRKNQNYVNPPAGSQDANSAAPVDLAAIPTSNAAAQVRRNWADITEEVNPGAEEGFTLVLGRKRRRGSGNSPTTAAPSSNAGASRTIRRPQSSAGSVPRAQEIRATRAHIADARAWQASSSEEHCVYIEHSPELEPFHYLRALDRKLGGTAGVIQITKVNGHQLLGLTNRGLAERLISEGLEVEGTLLRAFPFRKRAERITVSNLPFFVADSAVITALSPYGRVTSIAPKQMKAGPYVYVDGRRDVFITLHEGITIERLPTRLDINIKGEAWPAYLSSGIRCSRCHGQGHRRAICPLLAGLANNTRMAPSTTPAGVPPPTTPAPPQRSAAQPPAPTPSNPAMEVCSAPPVARAALYSSAPRPSLPAAPAFPMEETPPAPPPVTPAPSLRTPGSREPAAPTPDVEMSIVETFASATSSAKNATRVDLDAFIEGHPSVSFAKTDALGLGREEVLDLLSSRTKAQRKGPLLSPPQCDALAGLIGQILDLRPGAASNLYKLLGQVRAELRTTPAVPPTPPLPAPRPAETAPPAPQGEESAPAEVAYPPPLPVKMTDEARERWLLDLFKELNYRTFLIPLLGWTRPEQIIRAALHSGEERNDILGAHPNQRSILANFLGSVIERARGVSDCLLLKVHHMSTYGTGHDNPVSRMATNFIRAESPSKAEQKPVRHGSLAHPCAELSANQDLQNEIPIVLRKNQNYVNPPAGGQDANSAAPVDLAAIPTSNAAAQVRRNWADITEEVNPGAEEGFTLAQGRKRRRGSGNSPTTAAPSSNAGASRTIRRPQSSAGSVPRAQEIRATRAHIADARARQASSSEEHCVYIEHSPELEPFHYLRALDRKLGGTAGVIQITKVNGHQLLGLTNRGLAERLISEGLEVEGTLLRAFPFRKRAERITVGNLPFFVADSAVITALSPYGRVTSIAPKQMKAGPYVYVDGRRDVFITLHEGITIERLPTRLDINIKGEAWPAYLSSGIRCSRCHGQGHRRAICPLLAGLANNTRMAPPTTPAGVPPPTTPAPPQRSAAQPPAPTHSNPAMEVCSAPPVARAALHSSAPRPSPPAAPAFPMEETPPAPPPVTPAPSLRTPGSREPAAPTPDVEMSIVEETFASSTSSAKNATRVDLDAFIEGHPSVSFAKTDALGLGREEVLDLLSSRTKAQRKGPLLSPPQCDALVGLIGQILDLRPGAASNLYKVLGQVRAELRTTPAVPPTPPLPAPRPAEPMLPTTYREELTPPLMTPPPPAPTDMEEDDPITEEERCAPPPPAPRLAGPIPPVPHGDTTTPAMTTPPPPPSMDRRWKIAGDYIHDLSREIDLEHTFKSQVDIDDIVRAVLYPGDREPFIKRLPTRDRYILGGFIGTAIWRARDADPSMLE